MRSRVLAALRSLDVCLPFFLQVQAKQCVGSGCLFVMARLITLIFSGRKQLLHECLAR